MPPLFIFDATRRFVVAATLVVAVTPAVVFHTRYAYAFRYVYASHYYDAFRHFDVMPAIYTLPLMPPMMPLLIDAAAAVFDAADYEPLTPCLLSILLSAADEIDDTLIAACHAAADIFTPLIFIYCFIAYYAFIFSPPRSSLRRRFAFFAFIDVC